MVDANLKHLLFKLGIKAAGPPTLERMMWEMVQKVALQHGAADEMFLSGSALNSFLELTKGSKHD